MQREARLFLFFTFTAILIFNFQPQSIIRPSEASSNDVFIKLQFSPDNVESGNAEYSIGYLSIVNGTGFPALAPRDLEIKLTSSNSDIATVPSNVTILKKHDYAKFDVKIGNNNGKTKVSAIFNDQTASQDFIVGPTKVNMPKDVSLGVNIPATIMNVNSQILFSVFLQSNNTILKAPDDIRVSLDYDKSLTTLDHDVLVIK
ncbi:MAG: hypothetical protein KGL95_02035, partial [Patescibacteria group bacterium]|nr:hypothetical protein [Patescibacteria group bacterium]